MLQVAKAFMRNALTNITQKTGKNLLEEIKE